jgi:hypothetical protein
LSRTLQLYQLQSLDSDIDKTKQALAEVAARLGESDALKEARSLAETAKTELRQTRTVMQDLDLEVKSLASKIEVEEKKLYSGKVLNAKEAANLQDEVTFLKRRYEAREERLLETMMAVEEAEETQAKAQAHLASIEATWETDQARLRQQQDALNTTLSELQARRPTLAALINPADLSDYETLRPKKGGRAVVAVKDGVCQGCGMMASNSQLQRARSSAELTYCTACGRIFYIA